MSFIRIRFTNAVPHFLVGTLTLCLVSLTNNIKSSAQEPLDRSFQREIAFLLLDNDIGALANKLAAEDDTAALPLLRKLYVFVHAGHRDRARETLKQLADAPDWQVYSNYLFAQRTVSAATPNDLNGWRLYYDHLYPYAGGSEAFVKMWEQCGDGAELDAWLAARSSHNEDWLALRISRLAKKGRAGEVLDPLAAEVKANPRDMVRVNRYLRANNLAGNLQDVAWLADAYQPITACDYDQLGHWLQRYAPQVALKSFEKSLSLLFTPSETDCVSSRLMVSITPPNINWEKQLRFWTRRGLAETYQALNRPQDAQPYVEQLVAMNGRDIVTSDIHGLAGAVQRQSGARVVEGRILQDEAPKRAKADYWLERARYYSGREEYELEDQTYRKALEAFPYTNDVSGRERRLEIVRSFAFSLAERDGDENRHAQIAKLLRREFSLGPPGTPYAFKIAELITDNEFELEELKRALFVDQPSTLARLLEQHAEWDRSDEDLIEDALDRLEIAPDQLDKIWSSLERLVREPGSLRAYHLALAMSSIGADKRATALFENYLKHARPGNEVDPDEIIRRMVRSYCANGNWNAAEKALLGNKDLFWESMPQQLGLIAVTAAQRGAPDDAVRLWRMKANFDRSDLKELEQLSQTEARQQLRAFYLRMKKDDPLTQAPDQALKWLQ